MCPRQESRATLAGDFPVFSQLKLVKTWKILSIPVRKQINLLSLKHKITRSFVSSTGISSYTAGDFPVFSQLKLVKNMENPFDSCTKANKFAFSQTQNNSQFCPRQESRATLAGDFPVFSQLKLVKNMEILSIPVRKQINLLSLKQNNSQFCVLDRNRTCNYSLGRSCYIHLTTKTMLKNFYLY